MTAANAGIFSPLFSDIFAPVNYNFMLFLLMKEKKETGKKKAVKDQNPLSAAAHALFAPVLSAWWVMKGQSPHTVHLISAREQKASNWWTDWEKTRVNKLNKGKKRCVLYTPGTSWWCWTRNEKTVKKEKTKRGSQGYSFSLDCEHKQLSFYFFLINLFNWIATMLQV